MAGSRRKSAVTLTKREGKSSIIESSKLRQATKELEESRERYHNLFENSKDAVYVTTREGKFASVNQSMLELFDYTREEILSLDVRRIYAHPDDRKKFRERIEQEGHIKDYQLKLRRKDRTEMDCLVTSNVWRDTSGNILGYQGIIRDITERKQAEHSLSERIKELNCLYGIASIVERPEITLDELYREVANLLPPSWRYPEITCARITFGDEEFRTDNFKTAKWVQSANINVRGQKEGTVEVYYLEERPEIDEGPFIKEERLLINAVAERLGKITERKQAEESLRESEMRYRSLFEQSQQGIVVLDMKGVITACNSTVYMRSGYSKESLIGKHFSENASIRARDVPKFMKILASLIRGKVPKPLEVIYTHKDGTTGCTEVHVSLIKSSGKKRYIQVIQHDITEHKQAEEKIKEAAEEWETTFDSIADSVFICDKDFRLVKVNKAFADVFKMKPEELIGKYCYEVVHGANEPVPYCPHKQALADGRPHRAEFFEPHLGIHLETTASPIFDEKGEVVGTVHISKDITERKQVEETAREAEAFKKLEQLRTELLSNVSHELRTPLAAIKGYSTLLLHYGRKLKRDRQLESLKSIDVATDTLTKLVEQLLTMSRLESGLVKTDKQLTDISEMIRGVVAEAKVWSPNHKVESKLDETLPQVNIDAAQIKEVLNNLIDNAVKYSPEGSAIVMEAREAESEVVISVTDQGWGIPKKGLEKVFDRMYRIEQRVIPGAGGTGLGLAICKALVEAHDGRIWVESEVRKGSTFYFSLPKQTITEGHSNGEKA